MTLNEQLGNILSEISRAYNRKKIGDLENEKRSLERVLGLIDLTLVDKKHSCNLKEVRILRNVICDKYTDRSEFDVTYDDLQDYLLPFAILARR